MPSGPEKEDDADVQRMLVDGSDDIELKVGGIGKVSIRKKAHEAPTESAPQTGDEGLVTVTYQPLPQAKSDKPLPKPFQRQKGHVLRLIAQIFRTASDIRNRSYKTSPLEEEEVRKLMQTNQTRIISVRQVHEALAAITHPDELLAGDMAVATGHVKRRIDRVIRYHDTASTEAGERISRRRSNRAQQIINGGTLPVRPRTAPNRNGRVPFPTIQRPESVLSTTPATPTWMAMPSPRDVDDDLHLEPDHKPLYTAPVKRQYQTEEVILRRLSSATPTSGRPISGRPKSATSGGSRPSSRMATRAATLSRPQSRAMLNLDSTLIGELVKDDRIPADISGAVNMTAAEVRTLSRQSGHSSVPFGAAVVGPAGEGAGYLGAQPSEFEIEAVEAEAAALLAETGTIRPQGRGAEDWRQFNERPGTPPRSGRPPFVQTNPQPPRNKTPPRSRGRPVQNHRYIRTADPMLQKMGRTRLSSSINKPAPRAPSAPRGRPGEHPWSGYLGKASARPTTAPAEALHGRPSRAVSAPVKRRLPVDQRSYMDRLSTPRSVRQKTLTLKRDKAKVDENKTDNEGKKIESVEQKEKRVAAAKKVEAAAQRKKEDDDLYNAIRKKKTKALIDVTYDPSRNSLAPGLGAMPVDDDEEEYVSFGQSVVQQVGQHRRAMIKKEREEEERLKAEKSMAELAPLMDNLATKPVRPKAPKPAQPTRGGRQILTGRAMRDFCSGRGRPDEGEPPTNEILTDIALTTVMRYADVIDDK